MIAFECVNKVLFEFELRHYLLAKVFSSNGFYNIVIGPDKSSVFGAENSSVHVIYLALLYLHANNYAFLCTTFILMSNCIKAGKK